MSTETTTATPTPPTVKRNNVEKVLEWSTFGKMSPNKGKQFPTPVIAEATFDTDVEWVGKDDLIKMTNKVLRTIFAGIWEDNFDAETGEFNTAQAELDWADFSAGVQKLTDIDEDIDALQAEQQKYALDPDWGFDEIDADGQPTEKAKATMALIKDVAQKIRPLRIQRATISAKYEAAAAKRKAKKEAAEIAAAKAKLEHASEADATV